MAGSFKEVICFNFSFCTDLGIWESNKMGHSFSTYSTFSEKLTSITSWYAYVLTCAYQGVRNVSFVENFAYILNEWSLMKQKILQFWSVLASRPIKLEFFFMDYFNFFLWVWHFKKQQDGSIFFS